MKQTRILRVLSAMLLTLAATAGAAGGSSQLPPAGYDEARDPAADLKAAVAQAQRENKRILLEVGGEWCIYCRILNKVIHDDERLTQRLRDGFVVIKVNFSDKVKNEAFLSRYPQIPSYPHLFLLESDGALLLSQTPDDFMKDDKYVPDLILAFLEKWEPKRGGASDAASGATRCASASTRRSRGRWRRRPTARSRRSKRPWTMISATSCWASSSRPATPYCRPTPARR